MSSLGRGFGVGLNAIGMLLLLICVFVPDGGFVFAEET